MPISRDNFAKGRSEGGTKRLVEEFLEKNNDSAFTLDEICSGIFDPGKARESGPVNAYQIVTILQGLMDEGRVVMKDMPDATYYMWK